MTATIHAFSKPPRAIQHSHAILARLIAGAFGVIARQGDDDRLAEDLVEQISLTVLSWAERHGLDNETIATTE